MSDNKFVTADAQFENAKILRPPANFNTLYQGQDVNYPILFSEGGVQLDSEAGQPGYSNYLAKGLRVPYGARVSIWLPRIVAYLALGTYDYYKYTLVWRIRNLYDFRQQRIPYHFPRQQEGEASTLAGDAGPRVVLPAAIQSVVYAGAGTTPTQDIYPEVFYQQGAGSAPPFLPLYPNTAIRLTLGQGILDPGNPPTGMTTKGWLFTQVETQAQGDELLLLVNRPRAQGYTTWNFLDNPAPPPGADYAFWQTFTSSEMAGVYVLVGSAP